MNTPAALTATGSVLGIGLLARLAASFSTWRAVRATETAAEHLDAHLLRDIGLDPAAGESAIRRRLLIG